MTAAAFFDLDRTLLRRSSALALAGSFREHGVIGRGQLAKAAAWHGFDGAIGSTCEIVDGVYTGRSIRGAHGEGKAAAIRELAEQAGIDLAPFVVGAGAAVWAAKRRAA